MAAVTFDDEPTKPAATGGVVTFDDAPAKEMYGPPAELSSEQVARREALKKLVDAKTPGRADIMMDAATFGLSKPLGAAMSAVGGKVGELFGGPEATFGDRYRGAYQAEKDYVQKAEENVGPQAATAATLLGGLGGGGKFVMDALPTAGRAIAQATGIGGVQGAAENAGTSLWDAGVGALKGAGRGLLGSTIIGGLLNRFQGVQNAKRAAGEASRGPTPDDLRTTSQGIYQNLDNAGIAFSNQQTPGLATDMATALGNRGYDRALHQPLNAIVDDVGRLGGQPMTFSQMQNLRTRISQAMGHDDANVRRIAGEMAGVMDNFATSVTPAMNVGGVNLAQDLPMARDLYRRASQTADADWLSRRGTQLAADPERKVQQNFQTVRDRATRPGAYNPYNPEQMEILDQIVGGTRGQNTLSNMGEALSTGGKWLGGSTLLSAAGLGGASYLGGYKPDDPTTAAAVGGSLLLAALGGRLGGRAMQRTAGERGMQSVDRLIRNIGTGTSAQPVFQVMPRDEFATLLAKQQAQRLGGTYASGGGP